MSFDLDGSVNTKGPAWRHMAQAYQALPVYQKHMFDIYRKRQRARGCAQTTTYDEAGRLRDDVREQVTGNGEGHHLRLIEPVRATSREKPASHVLHASQRLSVGSSFVQHTSFVIIFGRQTFFYLPPPIG